MLRGARWFLVLVLGALAGCSGWFFAEREPWRHEAEVACLSSGAVQEGPGKVRMAPVNGPGICGADFPLKVSMLGESARLGYSEELRPPSGIPNAPAPRWPVAQPPPYGAPDDLRYGAPPLAPSLPGIEARPPSALPRYEAPEQPYGRSLSAPVPGTPIAVGPVSVNPPATLACPIAAVLDQWIASSVQGAALRWFGEPVIEIKQISAYSCRGMNGDPNARISEHAFGNALDIAAFTLADGRKVTVKHGWHGSGHQ